MSLVLKQTIREKHYIRCLKIQNFLYNILLSMLQDNLKINFVIKFNAIEYITIDFNNIVILCFCSIKATQQAFNFFFCISNIANIVSSILQILALYFLVK